LRRPMMKNWCLHRISVNVILLGIVSFLNDLSSEMMMPILPMFISSLGGAGLAIGLISGLRDSISSILQVLCGHWSDRIGNRKAFLWAGYLTSAFFKLSLAACRTYPAAGISASLERVGKGLRTAPRDAIIADSMPDRRGRGFGIHRALDCSGAVLGSVLAFLLLGLLNLGYRHIILIAAIIGFASLIIVRFVRETGAQPHSTTLKIGLRNLPKPLRLFIPISAVFALGNFSYMFFIMRAQQFFAGEKSVTVPILLYVLFNIFYAVFSVPLGIISDRIGRQKGLVIGYGLFAVTCLGFAVFSSLPALVVLFALYGFTYAAIDAGQRAFVSDLSSPGLKATALGTFHTTTGISALVAGLAAGLLWQIIGPHATFIYGGVGGFSSALLLATLARRFHVVEESAG